MNESPISNGSSENDLFDNRKFDENSDSEVMNIM